MSFSGYVLNMEQDNYYYMSLSRLHPQRIHASKKLSESRADPPQQTNPCSSGAEVEHVATEAEAEADSEVGQIYTINYFVKKHF